MEIKNLKQVAQRINSALKNKQSIILYGDADVDGVTSVVMLEQALNFLAPDYQQLIIYIINREQEGYGLNKQALNFLKSKLKQKNALLITVDCGIGNVEEVEMANQMGMEVIIIDHHEVLELPNASLIVDPKQKDDPYPFKGLATAGIIYRLVKLLLKSKPDSYNSWLELAALATIADRMPLRQENKKLVNQGLAALDKTKRPGLRALKALADFKSPADLQQVQSKLLPILNSSKVENHLSQSYLLIKEQSTKKAQKLVEELRQNQKQSSAKMKQMCSEIESRVDPSDPIIFEGDRSWPITLAGAVATKVCRKFKKPTFILSIKKKQSRGGVRVPKGFDAVQAMSSCKNLLEVYGGHPRAAGFTVANKNLNQFKQCLTKYFSKQH